MIEFTVNDTEFREWVITARSRFETMTLTMIDVAEVIRANTEWRVPLDTERLAKSFHWILVEENPNLVKVALGYDAVDPKTGYHYAEYQHTHELNHPERGERWYLRNGIQASKSMAYSIIKTDYMSLFGTFKGGY